MLKKYSQIHKNTEFSFYLSSHPAEFVCKICHHYLRINTLNTDLLK